MPEWVVGKIMDALNDRGKALHGAQVLVLGIAYKKNVDDMRESPSVELMNLLKKKGAEVLYADPFVPKFPPMRKYKFDLASTSLTPAVIERVDCVLVATDHDDFDYQMIGRHAQLIVDTRGVFDGSQLNVVKA